MSDMGFGRPFPPSRAIGSQPVTSRAVSQAVISRELMAGRGEASFGVASLEDCLEQAIPIKEELDRVRGWGERLSPRFQRACSAGRLLFQFVGVAGYAGYFASMHTFMRLVSGGLMAGAWYLIYRAKEHQL